MTLYCVKIQGQEKIAAIFIDCLCKSGLEVTYLLCFSYQRKRYTINSLAKKYIMFAKSDNKIFIDNLIISNYQFNINFLHEIDLEFSDLLEEIKSVQGNMNMDIFMKEDKVEKILKVH